MGLLHHSKNRDRIVALRSAVRTMGGVFGGAEAIPVVETTTRSLRNVPKGKELVHQLPKKEGRIRKIRSFGHGQTVVKDDAVDGGSGCT